MGFGTCPLQTLPPGPITLATIMKFFVKTDDTCVLEVSGQNLVAALENSVSAWPAEDSRFCQVGPVLTLPLVFVSAM
jgi:hypothetical protein